MVAQSRHLKPSRSPVADASQSVVAQGLHRIEMRGPPSRKSARKHRDCKHTDADPEIGNEIRSRYAIQHPYEQPGKSRGGNQAKQTAQ